MAKNTLMVFFRHITLANRITLLRIAAVPVFVLMLVYYTMGLMRGQPKEIHRIAALTIFLAAALTDALDGYLARARGEITALGRVLDPLADKALLLSGLILLGRPSLPAEILHVPIWFLVLVVSRDVVLLLGAVVIHTVSGRLEVRPRVLGKLATVFQMITILWILAKGDRRLFLWWVGAAAVCTFVSGLQYLADGLKQLEQHGTARSATP